MPKLRRQSKASDSPIDKSTLLTLHVIGTGVGESLVLQIPHETQAGMFRWAVIDCYCKSSSPKKNKTLAFLLRNRELGAGELEFVCLTHPHADHILGMSQILGCPVITTKSFWRFPADDQNVLEAFRRMRESVPAHADFKDIAEELTDVFKKTDTLRNAADQSKYIHVHGYNSSLFRLTVQRDTLPFPIELRVASLAPSGTAKDKYTNSLAKCIKPQASGDWLFDPDEFDPIQNSISVVLLVVFGKTRLILGADAERSNWDQVWNDASRKRESDTLSCDVVKVSHHGSDGAFHSDVWTEHGTGVLPVSILTPYSPRGLPRPEMIARLGSLSSALHVTSGGKGSSSVRFAAKSHAIAGRNAPTRMEFSGARIGCSVEVNHEGRVVAVRDLSV